jgi:hypothetical protein
MSTVRATTHTASPGDSATVAAADALPLATPPTPVVSRSDVRRPGKAAAVIARLPDVATANEMATLADGVARCTGAPGFSNTLPTAWRWLYQRWRVIIARWRQRSPLPRDRRRAAIIGGSVACGLGLIAIGLLVAPRLGKVLTGSRAKQPPIADNSWKSFSVETPMLPPAGAANVGAGAQGRPVATTGANHVYATAAPLWTPPSDAAAGNDNLSSSAPAVLFPSLPDRGGTSPNAATSQTSNSYASAPYTSVPDMTESPATTGPQMTAPTASDPAVVVSNQPQGLTPPDPSAAGRSSGSEVFTWRRDEAAAQQPSGSYAPAQPSAMARPGVFRAPQATPTVEDAQWQLAQHGDQPNTHADTRHASGYQSTPMPGASAAAPQGLMPEDTVSMEQHFPTTPTEWSNQRRQWATSGARQPLAYPPTNTTQPYDGYGPGTDAAPYAADPPNYPAMAGQDANLGRQPFVQSFRR